MKIVQDSQRQFSPWLIASWLMIGLGGGHAALPPPQMTYLDNGEVRVGMDLSLGGAVTFISSHDHPATLINSADLGRQIQMSHYSGPWPFEPGGKKPTPAWAGLGWNPIQTGDCHLNPSRVLESRNQGGELYIKCVPMQWPLDQVPGDCLFETWTTLEGPVIHMRFRCTNQRDDHAVYRPCAQELPAVYTISTLCRLMAYTGEEPFTGGALTRVANDWHQPWPWTRFIASERWIALVDTNDWGLGVFKDDGGQFDGGIYGDGRSTDPKDGSTAYVAPIHTENFDFNIVYEHRTDFMVGRHPDPSRLALPPRPPALDPVGGRGPGLSLAWRVARDHRDRTPPLGEPGPMLARRRRAGPGPGPGLHRPDSILASFLAPPPGQGFQRPTESSGERGSRRPLPPVSRRPRRRAGVSRLINRAVPGTGRGTQARIRADAEVARVEPAGRGSVRRSRGDALQPRKTGRRWRS